MSTYPNHAKTAWTVENKNFTTEDSPMRKKRQPLKERLREHGENSNIHGIKHILTRRSKFRSFIWITAFLGLVAFAFYQLMNIYFTYTSYQTTTNVKIEFKPLRIPYVSVCNMNPIRKSKVDDVSSPLLKAILSNDNISAEIESYNSFLQILDDYDDDDSGNHYDDDSNDENDDNTADDQNLSDSYVKRQLYLTSIKKLPKEERVLLGHDVSDMVMSCEFRGAPCTVHVDDFLSAYYGNCFTFDTSKLIAGTAGPSSGLTMVVNLQTFETVELTEGYGMILVIHEKDDIVLPENEGIVLSGGMETQIGMKLTQIRRQGPPYSECKHKTDDGKKYTFSECMQNCINNIYQTKCDCDLTTIDFLLNDDEIYNYCLGTAKDLKCSQEWQRKVLKDTNSFCPCPPPCREDVYTVSVSSRQWPTDIHREKLLRDVCNDQENCSLSSSTFTTSELQSNFLKLALFFEDLNHEIIEEVPVYDSTQLLSDIGGSLGLCLGVSLLCIVEMIEVMLEICGAGFRHILRRCC